MQLRRYQWVGLMTGLLLFSGTWLTAYYNNWVISFLTLVLVSASLYTAVRVEQRALIPQHLQYGAVAGLLAGVVARLCGLIATKWTFGGSLMPTRASYGYLSGFYANLLNGHLPGTITAIVMTIILGACVAFFEPERRKPAAGRKAKGQRT